MINYSIINHFATIIRWWSLDHRSLYRRAVWVSYGADPRIDRLSRLEEARGLGEDHGAPHLHHRLDGGFRIGELEQGFLIGVHDQELRIKF